MSGLVYQVVWVRELVLVFGATTFAVSTVLTAFMGGLALGSFYFGRRSEKIDRPLRLYGILEIAIGLYGLAVPFIFALLPGLYHPFWQWFHLSFFALSIVRFIFAALVLILPTALMGATLPVLSNFYARDIARVGLRVGSLYALNTFGAVLGASITGFLLIPIFGMRATTAVAAAINIMLGAVSLYVARAIGEGAKAQTHQSVEKVPAPGIDDANAQREKRKVFAWSSLLPRALRASRKGTPIRRAADRSRRIEIFTVLVAFGVSGFIALSYEVIWSRVLALIIGSSVYAFSIMLTTFLVGLAVGASVAARFVDRMRQPVLAFALLEVGIGITSLVGAYLFNDLPYIFVQVYRLVGSNSFELLLVARFLISSFVMIVPTLLLGALFPLVVRIISRNEISMGRTVGTAYAANTIGSIIGSFASGFVLVPWLGLLDSLRLCAALNFVVAAALFIALRRGGKQEAASGKGKRGRAYVRQPLKSERLPALGIVASAILIITIILFQPPWDSEVMSSAVYRYAPTMSNMSREELFNFLKSGQGETLFYKEGITATVAVQRQQGGRVLKVNGKPEASTAGDMPTQILIGTLPLLAREKTDDVLLIGLGSGVTLGSIEQFPVSSVTCVELEPAVVEATRFFEDVNNRPLEDPRLHLVSNDGRNFVYTTDKKFDVIVSEPSNPWLTGVANLFTLEYFKRGADRLKEGGLFCQWLQIYEMVPEDVRTLVATFRAAFPYVYVFRGAEGDLMMLGSRDYRPLNIETINSHFRNEKVAADHMRISTASAADVVSRLYLGPQEVSAFSKGAPLNTDNNALIEFNAPRRVGATEETVEQNRRQLLAYAASPLSYIEGFASYSPLNVPGQYSPSSRAEADFLIEAALGAVKRNDRDRARQLVVYSLEQAETAQARSIMGELRLDAGDQTGAVEEWQASLVLDPNHFYSLINLGKLYLTNQEVEKGMLYLDRALELNPESARANHLRGLAYQAKGDHRSAALAYRKALPDKKYTESIPSFYLNFGTALMQVGYYEEALPVLEEFARLSPREFDAHFHLGVCYEILSERLLDDSLARRAADELRIAISIEPRHAMSHYYLSKAYRRLDMHDQADAAFEIYERLLP
jgi:spermidine synthase